MAAEQRQKIKGNPAHTRMGNPRTKAYKAKCWERGEARKKAHRAAQAARAAVNRAEGTSPWAQAKAARSARRRAA